MTSLKLVEGASCAGAGGHRTDSSTDKPRPGQCQRRHVVGARPPKQGDAHGSQFRCKRWTVRTASSLWLVRIRCRTLEPRHQQRMPMIVVEGSARWTRVFDAALQPRFRLWIFCIGDYGLFETGVRQSSSSIAW